MIAKRKKFEKIISSLVGDKKAKVFEVSIYNSSVRKFRGSGLKDDQFPILYSKAAYERIGEISLIKKDKEKLKQLLTEIKSDVEGFDSCVYEQERENVRQRTIPISLTIEIKEGEFQCRNRECMSKKTMYYQLQTRSQDEGMTTFVFCTICKKKYKFG